MVDMGSTYKTLVGKPEGKRPFVRPRGRWEVNIKMGLENSFVVCGLSSTGSGQDSCTEFCERSNDLSGFIHGIL
jgi:hypothetical protein